MKILFTWYSASCVDVVFRNCFCKNLCSGFKSGLKPDGSLLDGVLLSVGQTEKAFSILLCF